MVAFDFLLEHLWKTNWARLVVMARLMARVMAWEKFARVLRRADEAIENKLAIKTGKHQAPSNAGIDKNTDTKATIGEVTSDALNLVSSSCSTLGAAGDDDDCLALSGCDSTSRSGVSQAVHSSSSTGF